MTLAIEKSAPPLLVTIEGVNGAVDVELPGDVALSTLLPLLIQHPRIHIPGAPSSPLDWTIGVKRGQLLDPANTLHNYGVLEGTILLLQPSAQYSNPLPEVEQELTLPHENKLLVLQRATSFFKKFRKDSR
ncbi:EsaB/YukD family protein [Tumebacillus permanentifrigoris]|uniref:Type VII secretion system (Wss) protein YukD n=1 Tax=Tumebacillus permanentifrigoris TaxID=378543 RepID=A0A316DVZ0_9BACL|nr:EsaB/YukD family protein [Tumebacillus permanentifrigoris]PWK13515.1 type VII secretion system (Wss) protein YukD [Tumebacillus permanentifrigoris]